MPFPGTRFLNSASFLSVGSLAVVSAGGRTHMGLVEAIRQSRLDRNSSSTRTSRLAYTGLPFPPPDHPFEGYRQDAPCKSASQGALSRRTQNDNRHARSRPRLEPLDARGARLRSSSTVRHVTSLGGGLSTVVSVCSTACVTLATLSVGRRTSAGTCPRSASVPPHPFRPLAPGPQPGFDSCGEGVGALFCEECGCCCGELGTGWVAYVCNDPDGIEEPRLAVDCPPCAAAEFGYRLDSAASYVCAWEPLPRGNRPTPPPTHCKRPATARPGEKGARAPHRPWHRSSGEWVSALEHAEITDRRAPRTAPPQVSHSTDAACPSFGGTSRSGARFAARTHLSS
jgi:hypothetical protein